MTRILTILAGIAASLVMSASVFAQGAYEVKGNVSDQLGPVIGATVLEVNTSNGTVTDMDGNFTLKVSSADAVVQISCIGYATLSYKASEVPAQIVLKDDTTFLDEVVVIGYGTVKKSDMTGSAAARLSRLPTTLSSSLMASLFPTPASVELQAPFLPSTLTTSSPSQCSRMHPQPPSTVAAHPTV